MASTSPASTDDVVRTLAATPRATFVAARNEHVNRLRADGDRELASLLAALRKPSLATWGANAAAVAEPALARDLVDTVRQLQQPGELDVRTVTGHMDELLDQLVEAARTRLRDAGERADGDRAAQVRDALRVAALSPERSEALLDGRLQDDEADPDAAFAAALQAGAHRRPRRDGDDAQKDEREARARAVAEQRLALDAELEAARRTRDEAAEQLQRAERDVRRAERRRAELDGD